MYLIKTIKGDITKVTDVQAIVNAANNSDRKSTRLNSSHRSQSRMPSSA